MTNYNPHSSNFKTSSTSPSLCPAPLNSSTAINLIMDDDWELHTMFKQILHKFKGDMKSTFSHLATVHNETCGCQIGSSSHAEVTNKVWRHWIYVLSYFLKNQHYYFAIVTIFISNRYGIKRKSPSWNYKSNQDLILMITSTEC